MALGTSKMNYNDPRITVSFCKSMSIPIEKVFTKTLRFCNIIYYFFFFLFYFVNLFREKFVWAMYSEPDWKFWKTKNKINPFHFLIELNLKISYFTFFFLNKLNFYCNYSENIKKGNIQKNSKKIDENYKIFSKNSNFIIKNSK